ncbi:uncharacterized protein LOC129618365 [Condylostylus longicornis]|uniref:uncharacterized protein LOC129618365 n=1 Tax=Condylostylus longicornis TaxID=2530218 RepID=UPI00244DFDBF|nr:uncharacterized protein LOC129618365 [Condylostylus longicornis]
MVLDTELTTLGGCTYSPKGPPEKEFSEYFLTIDQISSMSVSSEQIQKALLAFDNDKDGKVFPNEVVLAQLSTGVFLNQEDKTKFEKQLGGKSFNYSEASKLIEGVTKGRDPKKELMKMFSAFDAKKDGHISAAEMKAVLQNLGEVLSPPQIDKLTEKYSKNDKINYSELIDYMLG